MTEAIVEQSFEEQLAGFLRAARDHIADPERWTPTGIALDKNGHVVGPQGGRDSRGRETGLAVRWSDWGARVYVGAPTPIWCAASDLLASVALERHGTGIYLVGVEHGHAAMLAVYDAAIERARLAVPT